MFLADLWFLTEGNTPLPGTDDTGATVALYGMIAALGVALLTGLFSVVNKLLGSRTAENSPAASKRVAREHEAWERWLLLNDIDPRKIKTGYESLEQVRHAPTT